MPNLSSLQNITTSALSLSNLILVTPGQTLGYQPQIKPNADGTVPNRQQAPALLFDYEGTNTAEFRSDITDHFVEDNTAVQDQIALSPERITVKGFIGELNDVVPKALKPIKFLADKLTTIGAYAPAISTTAILAYNEALALYQTAANLADSAVASWSSLTGQQSQAVIGAGGLTPSNGNQTKQQIAFQQFYGYWRSRTLFTIQTPWAVFQNMAIEELSPVQDEKTRVITEFSITFKMIRTAMTITTRSISQTYQTRAASQAAGLVDLGTSSPVSSTSLSSGLSTMGVA